jgi:recombinational DNA repair protein RecT
MLAYRLSSDAAELNLSLDPVYGHCYVGAFDDSNSDEDNTGSSKPNFVVAETTHGRLMRCYKQANLKTATCDVVYENDEFEINDGQSIEHNQPAFNTAQKGEVAGAYAKLDFTDGTSSHVFLSAGDLNEIAELSNVDTWHSVFGHRMMCKQALMEALRNCDWNQKHIIHRSLYLDAKHSQTVI